MAEHHATPTMSRRQILAEVIAAEQETRDFLLEAARVTSDPDDRVLFQTLAAREERSLDALADEAVRLDAEEFVQRALDV